MTDRYISLSPSAPHNLFDSQKEATERICRHIPEFPLKASTAQPDERFSGNHVIALLGGRGTGKTTALFHTRRRLLEAGDSKLLVAELFVPDILHSPEAIGPAVVQLLQNALHQRAGDTRNEKIEKLKQSFSEIQCDLAWFQNSAVPNEVLIRDSVSSHQFAKKVFDYHQGGLTLPIRFTQTLEAFLDALGVERVILMIDDADISVAMVEPIIDFVRYFLATPYVITVIAADYETLRRRLFNDRISRLSSLDKLPESKGFSLFGGSSDDFKTREVEAERDYVDAYLTKILPPTTRVHLRSIDHQMLLRHGVKVGADGAEATTEELLDKIRFHSALEKRRVSMAELVQRYPAVLESNLRAFINQFNVLYEIGDAVATGNRAFFGLGREPETIPMEPGLLQLQGDISDIDEAAVLRVLRVLLSSSVHANWREVWSYYKIIDVMEEPRLAHLINTAVVRVDGVGTAIDTLILRIGAANGEFTLRLKEEVEVFHLLMDLALHFGASYLCVMQYVGMYASIPFGYFALTEAMEHFLREQGESISRNLTLIPASRDKLISGLLSPRSDEDAIQPVHLSTARDLAYHFALTGKEKVKQREMERNEEFKTALADEKTDAEARLQLERRQMYGILYYAMDSCVDQLNAVYSALLGGGRVKGMLLGLQFTSNPLTDWGIVSDLRGWSFFRRVFRATLQPVSGPANWDALILLLMQIAPLPYQIMIACFSGNAEEAAAKAEVERGCGKIRDHLAEIGCIRDGAFVDNGAFRTLFADHSGYPRLARSVQLWPEVDFGGKGAHLLRFLDYLASNPPTRGPGENGDISPPSAWKAWVDRMDAVCREHAAAMAEKPAQS